MKLALDSSQTAGSIALWNAGRVVYSCSFEISITHSETLMPQVDTAFKFCGFQPQDIQAVLLTLGPGSFTGLRIGLASAKGIAFGLRVPLLAFSTLQLCALQRFNCGKNILAVLDAKMKEVYAALYDESLRELIPPRVCSPEELLDRDFHDSYIVGSGAGLLQPFLGKAQIRFHSAPPQALNAAGLFTLAELFPQEERFDLDRIAELEPLYLRESTAQIRRHGKKE